MVPEPVLPRHVGTMLLDGPVVLAVVLTDGAGDRVEQIGDADQVAVEVEDGSVGKRPRQFSDQFPGEVHPDLRRRPKVVARETSRLPCQRHPGPGAATEEMDREESRRDEPRSRRHAHRLDARPQLVAADDLVEERTLHRRHGQTRDVLPLAGCELCLAEGEPRQRRRLQRAMSGTGRSLSTACLEAVEEGATSPPKCGPRCDGITVPQAASRIQDPLLDAVGPVGPGVPSRRQPLPSSRPCLHAGGSVLAGRVQCSGKARPDGRSHIGFHRCSAMRSCVPAPVPALPEPSRAGDDVRRMASCGCFMVGIVRRGEHLPERPWGAEHGGLSRWAVSAALPDADGRRGVGRRPGRRPPGDPGGRRHRPPGTAPPAGPTRECRG